LCETLDEQAPVDALGHLFDERAHGLRRTCAAVRSARREALRHLTHQILRERQRIRREAALEGVAAFLGDERIGVLSLRKKEEADLAALERLGQCILQGAPGRGAPGAIAVECEYDLRNQPENAFQMLGRRRSAERRYGAGNVELMQPHDVDVSLDDEQPRKRCSALASLVEPVELAAFVKERRLRRVEVLRLALADHAAAERDDPAAAVADRKHDAIAEAVIEARARCPRFGLRSRSALALDDESELGELTPTLLRCPETTQDLVP